MARIESGIDYNHPVLGSNGFGPNKKIVTGYDFVGDNYMVPNPDPDPMDCNGHGTYVAVRRSTITALTFGLSNGFI